MSQVWGDYKVYIDWTNSGLYDGTYDDVSSYIHGEITFTRGREGSSGLVSKSVAGKLTLSLNNSDLRFSRFNSSGPLYGNIKRDRRIKITMEISGGGEVVMFAGRLSAIPTEFGSTRNDYRVVITARGALYTVKKNKNISVAMQTNIASGAAVGVVLDAISWPAGDRLVDTGKSTWPRFWAGGQLDGLQVLRDIEESEGGFLREGKDGKIVFEARDHRFNSPHTVSQATYTNALAGTIRYKKIVPVDTDDEMYNYIEARVKTYNLSATKQLKSIVDIWDANGNTGEAFQIGASETIIVEIPYPPEGRDLAVADWGTITLEANSNAIGSGSDLTSNIDITSTEYDTKLVLELENTGGTAAYIIVLKALGQTVIEGDALQVYAKDDTSISDHGKNDWRIPAKFISSQAEAQAFCDYYLSVYKEPRNALMITLDCNAAAAHLAEAQTRDISDRITVVTEDGLSGDYFVEQIAHRIYDNDRHEMTLLCSAVVGTEWGTSTESYTPKVVDSPPQFEVIEGATGFADDDPSAGYVSWTGVVVVYKDVRYAITDGNTNSAWIYWDPANPDVFGTSSSLPSSSYYVIGYNDGGTLTRLYRSSDSATVYGDVAAANALLSDIASDAKFTPVEKLAARKEWEKIIQEWYRLNAEASSYGITDEKNAMDAAFQALADYLNNGVWTGQIAAGTYVDFVWLPNTEPDLDGYYLYIGTSPGSYGSPIDVGNVTSYTHQFTSAGIYYAAISAYDTGAEEGSKSDEMIVMDVPLWISDAQLDTTTTIVAETFRNKWKAYYDTREALRNKIAEVIDNAVDSAAATASTAINNAAAAAQDAADAADDAAAASAAASAASQAASDAQDDADAANALLADIAADSKFTPVEKLSVRREWEGIAAEVSGLDSLATAYSITTEKIAYDNAFQALADYLNNGTWSSGIPLWISDAQLSTTTTIASSTFRGKFTDYYDARTALLNKVSDLAKSIADASALTSTWDGVTGTGKPDDNADVTGDNTSNNTSNVGTDTASQVNSSVDKTDASLNSDGTLTDVPLEQIDYAKIPGQTLFVESFENPNVLSYWVQYSTYNGTPTRTTGGVTGKYVISCAGCVGRYLAGFYIPYNKNWLYRISAKAKRTVTGASGNQKIYVGFLCVDSNYNSLGSRYPVSALDMYGWTIDTWTDVVGYMSGEGTGVGGTELDDPTNPQTAVTNTRYLLPIFILNYNDAVAANEAEIDCVRVEVFDEVGQVMLYTVAAADGNVNADKVVSTSINDLAVLEAAINDAEIILRHMTEAAVGVALGSSASGDWANGAVSSTPVTVDLSSIVPAGYNKASLSCIIGSGTGTPLYNIYEYGQGGYNSIRGYCTSAAIGVTGVIGLDSSRRAQCSCGSSRSFIITVMAYFL